MRLPKYPGGVCARCGLGAWAVRPDGSGYYCSECIPAERIFARYEQYEINSGYSGNTPDVVPFSDGEGYPGRDSASPLTSRPAGVAAGRQQKLI